ncbi:hypothetical protein GQ473_03570 [archaeon]|nr:hypothetical protein [archaeon]
MKQEIKNNFGQDNSKKIIMISTGIGIFSCLLGFFISSYFQNPIGIIFLILGLFIAIIPSSVINYNQYTKYHQMESYFPTFLKDFSEAIKSGMNFVQAFKTVSKSDYGPLSDELRHSANQLSWGVPFPKVLEQLASRIKGSKIMRQSFTIITEAYNSGGDIAETMNSIALNISQIRDVDEERKSILSQQVYIMYFIYYLFLGIIYALYKLMIPMLAMNLNLSTGVDAGSDSKNYCIPMQWFCSLGLFMNYDPTESMTYFKVLFLVMLIIQGTSSGILAGELSQGNATAGIKHAGIMVVSAIIVFILFV